MRFAYADPPYYKCSVKFYGDHPEADIYDTIPGHQKLVADLTHGGYDGWAMSMGSVDVLRLLPDLVPLLPPGARVAAWTKPFASFKPNVNPAYTWEPVIFWGGRKRDRSKPTIKDHCAVSITLKKGLTGAKPPAFNNWILDLLGYEPGDEMHDLFPGTGGMAEAVARRESSE